jgi:hypothetical protein
MHKVIYYQVKTPVSRMSRVYKCAKLDNTNCIVTIKTFLTKMIDLPSCYTTRKYHFMKCGCVKRLQNLEQDSTLNLSTMALMANKQQDTIFKDLSNGWYHHYSGYNLRVGGDKNKCYSFNLCMDCFLNILYVGRRIFKMLNETRLIPGANAHQNTGNNNASVDQGAMKSVTDFKLHKGKVDGEVYATWIIQSRMKQEL